MQFFVSRVCSLAIAAVILAAPHLEGQTAADFFDGSALQELRIEIHPSDWQKLQLNFLDNTYYPCNMIWRGVVVENVGIRSRGLGTRNALKPGLRVDFNRYEEKQEFLGLKSFVLDNLAQDASMLKERVSMLFFERMGLPAPRETHTRLYINGQYVGVYAIVESIDKRFLARTFGEDEGYLYEYDWVESYRFEYRGSDPSLYSPVPFKPQTNEKDPNPGPIEAMIRTINQSSDSEFTAAMAEYLDLRLFIMHVAIENFLAEWDGILGEFGLNNFYLYRFKGKNLFQFIPWDKDNAFGGPPIFEARIQYPIWQGVIDNVLTRRMMDNPELRNLYLETVLKAAELAEAEGGWLESEIQREYNQIREAAREDTLKQCFGGFNLGPCSNEEFEAEVDFLRQFARERSKYVRSQVFAEVGPGK